MIVRFPVTCLLVELDRSAHGRLKRYVSLIFCFSAQFELNIRTVEILFDVRTARHHEACLVVNCRILLTGSRIQNCSGYSLHQD